MPVCASDVLVRLQRCVRGSRDRNIIHDLHFCSVDFYIRWRCAVGWVAGVSAADIGHFGDHVVSVGAFGPERYADVLHAVALRTEAGCCQ